MLIAYRCKKDFSTRLNGNDCPSRKVRSRLSLESWPVESYCPSASAPKLNAVCMPCSSWDPAHSKPVSSIADACRLAETALCPAWPEVRRSSFVSPSKVPLMDAVCRSCRLFVPKSD